MDKNFEELFKKTMQDAEERKKALLSKMQEFKQLDKEIIGLTKRAHSDEEAQRKIINLDKALQGNLGKMMQSVQGSSQLILENIANFKASIRELEGTSAGVKKPAPKRSKKTAQQFF